MFIKFYLSCTIVMSRVFLSPKMSLNMFESISRRLLSKWCNRSQNLQHLQHIEVLSLTVKQVDWPPDLYIHSKNILEKNSILPFLKVSSMEIVQRTWFHQTPFRLDLATFSQKPVQLSLMNVVRTNYIFSSVNMKIAKQFHLLSKIGK